MFAVVFNEILSSKLVYTSQTYVEDMAMQPAMSYTPYAKSSKEQTGNITTFTKFEEGNLLSETRNNTESGNESDENSTFKPFISEEETYAISSGDEYYAETMYKDML